MCRRSTGGLAGSSGAAAHKDSVRRLCLALEFRARKGWTTIWMKTRFGQWEVEGQVQERVNNALAASQQGRLAREARGDKGRHWPPYGRSWPRLLLKWSSCSCFAVIQIRLKGTSTAVRRNDGRRESLERLPQVQPQCLCIGDRCLAGKATAHVGCSFDPHQPSILQQWNKGGL